MDINTCNTRGVCLTSMCISHVHIYTYISCQILAEGESRDRFPGKTEELSDQHVEGERQFISATLWIVFLLSP